MKKRCFFPLIGLVLAGAGLATVFGTVRGIVHDPQHRPIPGSSVVLKAKSSDYYLYGDPMHFSALGHARIKAFMSDRLREKLSSTDSANYKN